MPKKSIAEVLQPEDTVLINGSDDEIDDDEQDSYITRIVTESEALDSLDAVKFFAEIRGDKQITEC